jgi:RNA polymerase sigma-70 factor, ECF subfamily
MLTRLRSWKSQGADTAVDSPVDRLPDAQLADLAARGSENDRRVAFDTLYYRYVDAVHGYAFRRLGNREAAEDATSDVFRDVARSISTYREIDGKSFRSWLFTIVHHVVADHRYRQTRDVQRCAPPDLSVPDPRLSPEEHAIKSEQARWIRGQLAILPQREREVIELDLSGMKTAEIAEVLGIAAGAVHTARCRALDHLQNHLGLKNPPLEKRDVIDVES